MPSNNQNSIAPEPFADLNYDTIITALAASELAYDTYTTSHNFLFNPSHANTNVDPLDAQLLADGWHPVVDQAVLLVADNLQDAYQGVAFYKMIDGVLNVIVANRGSQSLHDFAVSDAELAAGATPQSDPDADRFYNAVKAWAVAQTEGQVNIIETGHSLGGQEADYVQVVEQHQDTAQLTTEAVTFDAPGIARGLAAANTTYDALNISVASELVHVGGSLLNAGYVGQGVTISGGTPLMPYASLALVGGVMSGGVGYVLAGLSGVLYQGFYKNHVRSVLNAYFQEHPALGGFNLLTFAPDQVTQGMVDQLAKTTAATYAQMSPDARTELIENLVVSPTGPPIQSPSGEVFTQTTGGDTITLNGSLGDIVTIDLSSNTLTLSDSHNDSAVLTLSPDGSALLSASWSFADPITGNETFNVANQDGSSTSKITYASGGYATSFDDGQGNVTIDYFTKSGVVSSYAWVHSDGSSGSGTNLGNGLTVEPDEAALDVPVSEYNTEVNPDGSYWIWSLDPLDNTRITKYDSSGNVVSTNNLQGSARDSDTANLTSVTSHDAAGDTLIRNYDQSNNLVSDTWTGANGGRGSDTYHASEAVSGKMVNTDGTSETYSLYSSYYGTATVFTASPVISFNAFGPYDLTRDEFDSSGTLTSDTWQLSDGATGSDAFDSSGSGSGSIQNGDGTSSTVSVSGVGIDIDNFDANGTKASEDWWHPDGSHGITVFDAGGGSASYTYLTNGEVQEVDYGLDGTATPLDTVPAGGVLSPDGSSFGEIANSDGTTSVAYTDSAGDSLLWNFASGWILQGTDHTAASTDPHGEFPVTLSTGQSGDNPYNQSTAVFTDPDGTQHTVYVNSSGQSTGQDWVKPDGSHGYDTRNADGSTSGAAYSADGSYYTYENDGGGNVSNQYYDSDGELTSDAWQSSDGGHGTDTYNTDGSSSGQYTNADGSSEQYVDDGQGNVTESDYSATLVLTASSWERADGSYGHETLAADGSTTGINYQADASYETFAIDPIGDNVTKYYTASDSFINSVDAETDGHGNTVTSDIGPTGALISQTWSRADGSSGSVDLNAGQVSAMSEVAARTDAEAVTGDASGGIVLGFGNHDTLTAGAASSAIEAMGSDDLVNGSAFDDVLLALGAGATLVGGGGSDLFEINDATDVVQAQAGGSDSIESSVSYTLPTNVDFLTLTGTANLTATGNSDEFNVITGNSGNDRLVAGSGSDNLVSGSGVDTLVGGSGTDQFYINNSADVIQGSSSIRDSVYSSVSYVLNAPVASLTLTGTGNLSATNHSGAAAITGNAGDDTLTAGTGADTLVAGSGVDALVAGSGNDTFVVNNSADVIQASAAHGADTVESSASYALAQYVDTLMLTGAGNLIGAGNSDAANLISGNAGDDTLIAGSGNDTLIAGSGIDTLIAGSGSDVLRGANGDSYQLNSGFGHAEMITSSGSATLRLGTGVDPTELSFGMTLGSDGSPALLIHDGNSSVTIDGGLTGTINGAVLADGIQLTLAELLAEGHLVSSTIVGADGNLVFDANAADSLVGGTGDDTLIGASSGDTLVGGVGDQQLYGIGSGDLLVGGAGQDTLYGDSAGDTFVGGTGDTQVYAGPGSNYYALTRGATLTIDQSDSHSLQTLILPGGMTAADFTSYTDLNGDLVVQSLSGDTTAIVKGLYNSATLWVLEDSGGGRSLRQWALSAMPLQTPDAYRHEIDLLREQYSVQMATLLNGLGRNEDNIVTPGSPSGANKFAFTGVTTQNISGDGFIEVGPSQSDVVQTHTTQQTVTRTYYEPIYQTITTPAMDFFEPNTSGTVDLFSGEPQDTPYVSTQYDSDGNILGWDVSTPAETYTYQTGTRAVTETYTIDVQQRNETLGFTAYNIKLGDQDDTLEATAPFVGTVQMGDGDDYVDLGLENSPDVKTIFGHPTYFLGELSPGAFIEAGNGNDTIYGTGGADTIAAGLGMDSLVGATGTTFYVPLEGHSADYINTEFAPYYGDAPYPHNTLVLPTGITPQDLQYRVMDDPDQTDGPNSKILQIRYGDSTVIAYFDAGFPVPFDAQDDDTDGLNYFQFSDGRVLTRDQVLAMATQASDDSAPVVSAENQTLTAAQAEQPVSAAAFFSGSGTTDNPVIWYQVTNTGGSGGVFLLNGQEQQPGRSFYVDADQLSQLSYVGGLGTHDRVSVQAFDGLTLSASQSFTISVDGSGIIAATGPDQFVQGTGDPSTLLGGYDGDTLAGYSGDDTFLYNAGGGTEYISENGSDVNSVVKFGYGITPGSVTLGVATDGSGNLVLNMGGSDRLVINSSFNQWDPYDSNARLGIQAFQFADGTTLTPMQLLEDRQIEGSRVTVDNGDGTTTQYTFTPGSETFFAVETRDATGALLYTNSFDSNRTGVETDYQDGAAFDTYVTEFDARGNNTGFQGTYADGSTDNYVLAPQLDGSSIGTEVLTPAPGQGAPETIITTINAQGEETSQNITNYDGNGGTDDTSFTLNGDGSLTSTEVATPGDGSPATTTVTQFDGVWLSSNSYTRSPDGSYSDAWSHQGGSGGTYWWQASSFEYQQNGADSSGTTWTDDYQYAAGGSPGGTGVSFTETYTDSAGDQGTRQYDAGTGVTSLTWYSSATGTTLTGTTTDAGFVGLQNDDELTNTQSDLTFFNPNVSPSFNAFLAGH
jgi:Ca2+-binding RTX toxin-like protein